MRTEGVIASVNIGVEEIVRRIATDNDKSIERLSLELGRAKEREGSLLGQILELQARCQELEGVIHDERQRRMLEDLQPTGTELQ